MYELSVIVPTRNERDNVRPLIGHLDKALAGISWEVLFVDDDSQDGTAELVREIGQCRPNVRCVQRVGRRGLSSACVEGMLATVSPYLAVMDGDLQHDETKLPEMLSQLRTGGLDIVVATRYGTGGSIGEFAAGRALISRLGTVLSRLVVGKELTDPMSGYFMLTRKFLNETVHNLSATGFKILLDLFASSRRPVRFHEVPFEFRMREHGASKLDSMVSLEFLVLIADKTIGRFVPIRFIQFVMVGALGLLVHLVILGLAFRVAGAEFIYAQAIATFGAMTFNYYLNNIFTYRDRRLHGTRLAKGLISFYLICGAGALVNFQVADAIFRLGAPWAFAGMLGAGVSSVWNYAVTATFTWTVRRGDTG